MHPRRSIFYSTLMLTLVHLLLRLIGTSFQIYLSGRIGAEGIGLLQLTLSAGSFAMVAGMAGIRTSSMYLTAEELGKNRPENVPWILSGCIRYSLITGGTAAVILSLFARNIATTWISDTRIIPSLRLYAGFMCVNCMNGVMTGYFTAAGRIGTLAAVEVAEQLFSMAVTVISLVFYARTDPGRACESVILGSGAGSCMTLACLIFLRIKERSPTGPRIPVASRLTSAAVPLAMADILKSGITTLENMLVPKRLGLFPGEDRPLAAFGILTGMVFPIAMFPACILHALSDLLIPELARCNAGGKSRRIQYLVHRSLGATLIYSLVFAGILCLTAQELAGMLYKEPTAGPMLKRYALLIPMLYCDAVVDAMTKGLGQQRICVRYNIITSAMDVIGLFFLLPKIGMTGYYISFLFTHAVNFLLSLNRLIQISGTVFSLKGIGKCLLAAATALFLCRLFTAPLLRAMGYLTVFGALLHLFGILSPKELRWIKSLVRIPAKA